MEGAKFYVEELLPEVNGCKKGLANHTRYINFNGNIKYKLTFPSASDIFRPTVVEIFGIKDGITYNAVLKCDGYSNQFSDIRVLCGNAGDTAFRVYQRKTNIYEYLFEFGSNGCGFLKITTGSELPNANINFERYTDSMESWSVLNKKYA